MLPTELWCLLAPPNSDSIVVIAIKILEHLFLWDHLSKLTSQLSSFWACTPFRHSGSVLWHCPYRERIICQTTIARTPSHWSVDDCCLALPPRLWQPHNTEGEEATVIEGNLIFPHSYWVSHTHIECHSWIQFKSYLRKKIHVLCANSPGIEQPCVAVQADLGLACWHLVNCRLTYVLDHFRNLMLSILGKNFSRQYIEIFFLAFPENRFQHFIQLVSNGDNLHEISNPVF